MRRITRKRQRKHRRFTKKGGANKYNAIFNKEIPEESYPEYWEGQGQSHSDAIESARAYRSRSGISQTSMFDGHVRLGNQEKTIEIMNAENAAYAGKEGDILMALKESLVGCDTNDILILKIGCNDNSSIGGTPGQRSQMGYKKPLYDGKNGSSIYMAIKKLYSRLDRENKKVHLRCISPEWEYPGYTWPWLKTNDFDEENQPTAILYNMKIDTSKYIRSAFPLENNAESRSIIKYLKGWKGPIIFINAMSEESYIPLNEIEKISKIALIYSDTAKMLSF